MPGFGMAMGPHGHLCVEFCDDSGLKEKQKQDLFFSIYPYFIRKKPQSTGKLYSVGMYMDPRSPINTKVLPFAVIKVRKTNTYEL